MEIFFIPVKFVFKGVFKVKANTLEEANNIVDKQCGMNSGEIHTQSPDNVDWEFCTTPVTIIDPMSDTNPWKENKEYPVEDWQHEVSENDTRLGYKDWVNHKKESNLQ